MSAIPASTDLNEALKTNMDRLEEHVRSVVVEMINEFAGPKYFEGSRWNQKNVDLLVNYWVERIMNEKE